MTEIAPIPQNFSGRYSSIINQQLSPDNINTYAENALAGLIGLSHDAVRLYSAKPDASAHSSGKDKEDAAFAYFKLPSIPETLDHVTRLAYELRSLDRTIDNATLREDVIVPPDSGIARQILTGEGGSDPKKIIPRLKTVLFVLKKDFGIDVDDPDQLKIRKGAIKDNMMRRESYAVIEAPALNHTVFICDEEGNVTYVFHNPTMRELAVTADDLAKLTKSDINELLSEVPTLGSRIVYTKNFVPNMQAALHGERDYTPSLTTDDEETSNYLRLPAPPAPNEVLSAKGIANKLGTSRETVLKTAESLGESLGETGMYRFGSVTTVGYSSEQQEKIEQAMDHFGRFSPPTDGAMPIGDLASSLGVSRTTILKAIGSIPPEEFGETKKYRFSKQPTVGYSLEQQKLIKQTLESSGSLYPSAPEGILPINGIAEKLGVANRTVQQVIQTLGESLGETQTYKFHSGPAVPGYSSSQQELIEQKLESSGNLSPSAPEGVLSAYGIAQKFGLDYYTVTKVISSLGEDLGETEAYRFKAVTAPGYSSSQQELIEQKLESSGNLSPSAPEGVLSAKGIANKIGASPTSVRKIIKSLGEELGDVQTYKFDSRIAKGYSPQQIELIVSRVDNNR